MFIKKDLFTGLKAKNAKISTASKGLLIFGILSARGDQS
jgi:hypothetical protein